MCDLDHTILINNFKNLVTIPYSVIFLEGEIETPCENESINFVIKQSNHSTTKLKQNNRFKHLLELSKGENKIEIQYCGISITLTLYYKPKAEFCVVPVYIVCKNHDGTFDSPKNTDNSISIACKKIVTGIKLIQCLLAEKFHENGMCRKTFQLESEVCTSDVPECRIHFSNLDADKVKQMKEDELWYTFGRELMNSELANEKFKYVAFLSCTHYRGDKYDETMTTHNDIVSITEAHAALGGGGLAIFGSACLHTWPTNIQDTIKCFEDQSVIDKTQLMDDSCYRGTFSGCFATTLGSVCHELCHTFDLGHTDSGIMARGFDKINEEFIITDKRKFYKNPPEQHCIVDFTPNIKINITENCAKNNKRTIQHNTEYTHRKLSVNENGIYFTRNCLMLLYYHRWFNKFQENTHFLKYEENSITSSAGICIIEVRNENSGMVLDWWDFNEKPVKNFGINKLNLRIKYNSQPLMFVAEDIFGNIIKHKI